MFQNQRRKAISLFIGEQKVFKDSYYPGDRVTYIKRNMKKPVEVEILQVLGGQTLWVRNTCTDKEYKIYQYELTEKYRDTSRPGCVPEVAAG